MIKKLLIILLVMPLFTLNSYSQTAKDYVNRGNTKSMSKDYTGAISEYNKAIEIDPNYSDAYHLRGTCKSDLGDHRGAIIDLTKAINLNPKEPMRYTNRGLSKLALGQKEEACLDFSKSGELGYSYAYTLIKIYCN
ncbi:TPR repeat protein [Algoriphagus aquaeductus]|uniref:TPR repeat protein n=1 Tax=Algoriphagus aquaeductus TaxID=475299 RepID=A0A326RZH6_9BACT|nr:tetratricopeptide repeat protein [Algoriphagus aquaeductus]PZV87261.1 TPR repeat protein [Algoriphagus aquaeductus]